jgi:origin recognition complex subunit 4
MKNTLELISTSDETSGEKCTVLFILENFEKFTHISKQTLLYNLFDLVQGSNHISLSVIGLTSRIVINQLLIINLFY